MSQRAIFKKDFTLVAAGQIISLFGNQILRYALPLYLLHETGSAVLFGTILACSFIPMILLFPIGGIIADRVNKRNIMVALDFTTGILILLFTLLAGKLSIVPLMAVTMILLYGIQGAYQPAVQASVPLLVKPEHIMKGNAVINLISSLAGMIGPVTGGILFSVFGLTPILYVSTCCFLASAIMEVFIHIPYEKSKAKGNVFVTGLGDLKESFHFMLHRQPALWKVSCVYASVNLLLSALIMIALPVIITQRMPFTPDTASRLYGYAQGGVAAGAIAGGVLAGMLSGRLKLKAGPYLIAGCALFVLAGGAALHLLAAPMQMYLVLVAASSLLVALSTIFQIQIMTHIQLLTPKELTGKVIACVICICMCASPVGQFIYGFVFDRIGAGTYLPFYMAGLIILIVSAATRRIFRGMDETAAGSRIER